MDLDIEGLVYEITGNRSVARRVKVDAYNIAQKRNIPVIDAANRAAESWLTSHEFDVLVMRLNELAAEPC